MEIRLKELLAERGLTMVELASKSGLNRSALIQLAMSRTDKIAFTTIDRLCEALDCKIGELLVPCGKD